jgi:glyoxylase-like metal-dependent hydrolase (beta-lactamase superfamily II)/rhodanese-related sulfurtransferase
MYFKQILNEDCGCSSYVVASRASRECAIVDAGLEIQPYLDVMQDRGLTLRHIVDTHLHADHVSGSRRLSGETGVPVSLHQSADVLFPFEPLHDGQKLGLGPVVLEVMHTPGHRPESVSLLITNPPRSPLPSMVLTGDCLFVGDVGRPDFGGPDAAGQQYESSRRLLGLEDYVEVFPAHFEGSCGRGMCGRPSSTIGFERRFNPMLQLPTKDEFVRELISSRPPKPLNMDAIIATNRGAAPMGWAMLRHPLPHVQDVTIEQARPKMDSGAWWVVDVREDEEWQRVHIPGAHHIPQSQLASRLSEIPGGSVPLVVCHSGMRSHRAAQFLKQAAFPVAYSLAGGTAGWQESGLPVVSGDTAQTSIRLTEVVGPH